MPAFIETGHAKNVANFQSMIVSLTGFGTAYNPAKNAFKLPQLNTQLSAAQTALNDVIGKNTAFNNAVNARKDAFEQLRSFSTRLINALQATDADKEKINDAKRFQKKIQGRRATSPKVLPVDPNTPAPASISASQQSYDQLIQHFAGLLSIIQSEPTYVPNETDLKTAALGTRLADLQTKNTAVVNAYTVVSNARINRDKILYKETTGLVDTAFAIKKYVRSVFGSTSPEYLQIQAIQFKRVRK